MWTEQTFEVYLEPDDDDDDDEMNIWQVLCLHPASLVS
jgi:hypothetical protein